KVADLRVCKGRAPHGEVPHKTMGFGPIFFDKKAEISLRKKYDAGMTIAPSVTKAPASSIPAELPVGSFDSRFPSAVVLSRVITGLATVRGLAVGGVDVHAVFRSRDPLHFSWRCRSIHVLDHLQGREDYEEELVAWLLDFGKRLGGRPVLMVTGDSDVLMLARYRDVLSRCFRFPELTDEQLQRIVCKNELYAAAQ